jgi:hypothetical protein
LPFGGMFGQNEQPQVNSRKNSQDRGGRPGYEFKRY